MASRYSLPRGGEMADGFPTSKRKPTTAGGFAAFWNIERWQFDYLFQLGFQGWLIHVGVVTLVLFVLRSSFPGENWPWLWWGTMLVLSLGLAALCRANSPSHARDTDEVLSAGRMHSLLTAIVGLTWGAGAIGAAGASFQTLLIYTLALGGTVLGAVSSQHSVPRSCFLSIWTSIPLLAYAHNRHGTDADATAIAAMMILYGLILSILSFRMFGFLSSNIALNTALDAKVEELTEVTRQLDTARGRAVEANEAKSRFLAQASHDLRQPIHAISLFTACLRDSELDREERNMVANIDRSLESVSSLFRSLLDISALEIGRVHPDMRAVRLADILTTVIDANAPAVGGTGGRLRYVPTTAIVRTDPALLTTILQNLVSNAVKYAPGADILVGARRRDGKCSVMVVDGGPGIPAREADRVFEEFYRVRNPRSHNVEGLGLGLSIVARLAALMTLQVDFSSREGLGTTVTIRGLETARADELDIARAAAPTLHILAGTRLLLVDDDPGTLAATGLLLEKWGCEVTALSDVPDRPTGCEILVTDFELADGETGLQCIDAVRRQEGRPVPALVVTGHSDGSVATACRNAGVPVLAKPVRPAELRAAITALLLADTAT